MDFDRFGRANELPPSGPLPPPPVPPGPPAPQVPPGPRRGALGSIAAAGAVLALKFKSALALLKFASLGKFALTGLSMLAMVWVEAQRAGWVFGVLFVLLIFIHEMGHAVAIRQAGLQAGWPVFIPFIGAMIALKGQPPTPAVEARIAYAGPVAGTLASLGAAAIFFLTGSRVWLAAAYTGFFLNLFNLVPISPLDGGRVAQAFSRRAWLIGGVLLGVMFFLTMAPQLLIIGALAVMHNLRRASADDPRLPLSDQERTAWAFRYFGLCFFLGACVYLANRLLHPAGI